MSESTTNSPSETLIKSPENSLIHGELGKLRNEIKNIPEIVKENFPSDKRVGDELYRKNYAQLTGMLWESLWLPGWGSLIDAIIRKESLFWKELIHKWSGSTGMMMLTSAPYRDMMDSYRIRAIYAPVFSKLQVANIKNIPFWDKENNNKTQKVIWETLPWVIWNDIQQLSDISREILSIRGKKWLAIRTGEFQAIIKRLSEYEMRNRGWYYLHVLNIIIWSVYLWQLNHRYRWDIWRIAERYNGNYSLGKNGVPIAKNYKKDVHNYFRQEMSNKENKGMQ